MKKIYLTFDIEVLTSKLSFNPVYWSSVYLGAIYIANELNKRNLKGTFFLSLSTKTSIINHNEYVECLDLLIQSLKQYPNISLQPHLHAFNIPVDFLCLKDKFSSYNYEQQVVLLEWAKQFFDLRGIEANHFRPGGYSINDSYYDALSRAGFLSSSLLLKNENVNINTLTGKCNDIFPFQTKNDIWEYPVTSILVKSIKRGKQEIVNLSPDFFTIDSVKQYIEQISYININFHSFSIFNNRLARENHNHQRKNNLKFLFLEKPINKILRQNHIETLHHNTIFKHELINWLDYFKENKYETFFIGE